MKHGPNEEVVVVWWYPPTLGLLNFNADGAAKGKSG